MPEPGLARDSDMTHERGRMRALLRPITVPAIAGMRHPTQPDEAALAVLSLSLIRISPAVLYRIR